MREQTNFKIVKNYIDKIIISTSFVIIYIVYNANRGVVKSVNSVRIKHIKVDVESFV